MARTLAAAGLWAALCLAGPAAADPTLDVVPEPLSVTAPAAVQPLRLAGGALVQASDPGARQAADWLIRMLQRTRGLSLTTGGGRAPAVVFRRDRRLHGEAYELEVGAGRVTIRAGDDAGLFYGAVTLWQLMTPDSARGAVTLSPVLIKDEPRFAWRGLLLDSARHFQPPEEIERIIDVMAAHKLNVLQWHLTDDQAWRIEIRKYPRLTEVGAWRQPPAGSPDGPPRYGGVYSQAVVRRIVAYAAARQVTIVPEIDIPGHAVSALLAYPELGAGPPPPAAAQAKWGVLPYVLSDDPKTLAVLEDVLTEVMQLFPGRYIHLGGDEAQHERWLAAGAADPAAVQARFTRRLAEFLAAHGRRLVGWDEILQGGALPEGAVVTSWRGVEGAAKAAEAGHDAVLAPAPVLYLDNWQGADSDGPPGRGVVVSLHDVYAFEPAPAGLAPEAAKHLLGLQGQLWSEHIRTGRDLEAMAFPRAAAIAESGWTAPARKDWDSFVRRLPALQARYAALGVAASAAALKVRIVPALAEGRPIVTLERQPGPGEIRYAVDGADPGADSPAYAASFPATVGAEVRAALFIDGRRAGPVAVLKLDPSRLQRRASQDLKLCNPGLALNLEGPPDAQGRRGYLTNPMDGCWIYPAVALSGVRQVEVSFARLPWNFSLDAAHNTVVLRPPRTPSGELEVRLDSCTSDPVAVVPVPAGGPGERGRILAPLPQIGGVHDVCFDFTADHIDPALAVGEVAFAPP